MSDSVIIALIIMVGIVLIVVVLAALSAWVLSHQRQPQRRHNDRRATNLGGYLSRSEPPRDLPVVDGDPAPGAKAEEPKADVPIPVHPEHMPVWRVYSPREGAEPRSCDCHQRPLRPGQPVLWWTRPDESVLLFCEDTVPLPEGVTP